MQLDTKAVTQAIDGQKTYLLLGGAAIVIVANHFGLIPPEYVPKDLNGANWVRDLYLLAFGATGRSALKKLEADTLSPDYAAKVENLAQTLTPIMKPVLEKIVADMIKKSQPDAAAKLP